MRHLEQNPPALVLPLDRIAKLLGLPDVDDFLELNADVVHQMAASDSEEDLDEAQRELTWKWAEGVMAAAGHVFGHHGLVLEAKAPKSRRRRKSWEIDWQYKVLPERSWEDAANRIRETINGVGMFEFPTLRDFIQATSSGTARQAVIDHLGSMRDFARVYGDRSPHTLYQGAFRNPAPNPPAGLTARGRRMYDKIKTGLEMVSESKSRQTAERTVRARARGGERGLVRPNPGLSRRRANPSYEDMLEKTAIANASEISWVETLWLFQVGAYGDTWVAVWRKSLEDALEDLGEYLAEEAPGLIMKHDDPELRALIEEKLEEEGKTWEEFVEDVSSESWAQSVEQDAFSDLTYTESGYITSHEWHVDEVPIGDERWKVLREKSYLEVLAGDESYVDAMLDGMTRALWVSAYSNFVDEELAAGKSKREIDDAGYVVAGAGEDWFEITPDAPDGADQAAIALSEEYARRNSHGEGRAAFLPWSFAKAAVADETAKSRKRGHSSSPLNDDEYAYDLGSMLGFMGLGHGISWFDSHTEFPLEHPSFETNYDGQTYHWSGGARGNPRR